MTQTYPLTITRNNGWYGVIRKLALYAATPSGRVKLGDVNSGQSGTVHVPQDATQIYGKMDWAKTKPLDLSFVNPNERIYANVRFTLNPFRNIGMKTLPIKIETVPRSPPHDQIPPRNP